MDKLSNNLTKKSELSHLDLIMIALLILIVVFLINRTKKQQQEENFQNERVYMTPAQETVAATGYGLGNDKNSTVETLLKQEDNMRNNLNDFINQHGLDLSFESKSLYQNIVSEKPKLDKYYERPTNIPEFKFEGNKQFSFDRLGDYKEVQMQLKKLDAPSKDKSGAPNYTTETATGFAYQNIDQVYSGELDISGGNFGTTTGFNEKELEAGF